jgi:CheY-like chemotaxis protein
MADILLSDIGLSGRDGYDLVRTLRRRGLQDGKPAFFAIALTAFSRAPDRQKAFDAGFDRHLAKPLDAQAVVASIAARGVPDPPER